MKKFVVVLVFLFAASALFANPIQLGNFPVGRWLDNNYDAIWDFSTNNIRILGLDGRVIHDFSTKTNQDFRVFMEGLQPGFSFSCPEEGRSYRFIASLPSTDVVMEIDRPNMPRYSVTMRRQ